MIIKKNNNIKRLVLYLVFILSIINFVSNGFYKPLKTKNGFYDFRVLYTAGKFVVNNPKELYKPVIYRKTGFNYLPIVSDLFIPLTKYNINKSALIWFCFNIIFLLLSFYFLLQIQKIVYKKKYMIITGLLFLNFRPIFETLKWGQLNILVFLLVILSIFYFFENKNIFSAFFMSLAIITKILPGIFLIYFLIKRKWKLLLYNILFLIIFFFISIFQFGIKTHKTLFLKKIPPISQYGYKGNIYDQSIQATCFRLFWADNGYTKPWFDNFKFAKMLSLTLRLLIFFLLIRFIFINRNVMDNKKILLELSIVLASVNLIHSLVWEHHLVWSLLLFLNLFILDKKNILLIICFVIVAFVFGYDNKMFTHGILVLVTSIKLFAIAILWLSSLTKNFIDTEYTSKKFKKNKKFI